MSTLADGGVAAAGTILFGDSARKHSRLIGGTPVQINMLRERRANPPYLVFPDWR